MIDSSLMCNDDYAVLQFAVKTNMSNIDLVFDNY